MALTWEEVESRARRIIVDELGIDPNEITLSARIIDDLGADSLDAVELTMRFEEEFKVEMPPDESDGVQTVEDIMRFLIRALPETGTTITSSVLAFRLYENGSIRVGLQTTDGTWIYGDGTAFLPAGLYLTVFSKWGDILKELEEMINSPSVAEQDLQSFFEKYPDLLKCDEYDLLIPQARIVSEDEQTTWKADFILHPFEQAGFCKILELKLPKSPAAKSPRHGHPQIYNQLLSALSQLRDYGEAFHSTATRQRFKEAYNVDVFKPDLQLIAGRKWDILHMKNMLELQRRSGIKVDDWDTCLDKLRRKFT